MGYDEDPFEGLTGDRTASDKYDDQRDAAFRQLVKRSGGPSGFYASMFADDLGRLVPYDSGLKRPYSVRLAPSDPRVEEIILNSLPEDYGPSRTLEDGLRVFAEHCVNDLFRGRVTVDVEPYRDPQGVARAFRVHPIAADFITRYRGRPIRYVPSGLSPPVHGGFHYVEVDPSTLVEIDLERAQRSVLTRALRALAAADRQQFVPTSMLALGDGATGFRVKDHQSMVSAWVRAETRELGWDARGLITDGMLDPYRVWRSIQFARFQVGVRDTVLVGFQQVLDVAGRMLGFTVRMEVEGLLAASELDEAETQLKEGTRSLSELSRLALMMPPRTD
ncbi:MAG: hypothetical protein QOI81_1181 [Actinomycetota bacterium]|nr:hypothetical protein [Actinomycetota bacterium]